MLKDKNIIIAIVFLAVVLAIAGVSRLIGPRVEEKPSPLHQRATPEIPEEISEGENQEPTLKVYISEEDKVEEMPFEEYIKGVVAGEMEPDWHEEALAAQAIIARSFTLQKIEEDGGVPERDAHASTDIEEFQAYDADSITEQVTQAVDNTRGEVAIHKGDFIRGWFHAFAGPRTALANEGLGFEDPNPPYIHIVESPGTDIIPEEEGDWEESFGKEKIRKAIQEHTGDDPGEVTEFEIANKGPSGRVTVFRANGKQIEAPELRIALGSEEMRSTFVEDIEVEENEITFSGAGFGHGVGMCQWGARAQAEEGRSAEEIVDYFYKNIEIVELWD